MGPERLRMCHHHALHPHHPATDLRHGKPRHRKGNCVLIGDAMHAVVPFIGQGANISLEDVDVLAHLLTRFRDDPWTAFTTFERLRIPRVRKIAQAARTQGERQYATSWVGAAIGQWVLWGMAKWASWWGQNLSPEEFLGYDGVVEVDRAVKDGAPSPVAAAS
ncbi:hypothetical protein M427DRAFT_290370 [Gonapodya prolifera JEL478]|uniref:FAD-binding domain-containing protein n=1 Tax=Gonapodya prolifera (strain JEL478) TaxID=1344416 RepID=A0A139AHW4_GONPJ|nr:hypothetical protein M427DRAFT_290370 [Gonapodya prolifera JEL478]|eukprot:KXS16406.1 hypothetical protein M427DRAFT_290370 [Gonapodya prolifera JEL478]